MDRLATAVLRVNYLQQRLRGTFVFLHHVHAGLYGQVDYFIMLFTNDTKDALLSCFPCFRGFIQAILDTWATVLGTRNAPPLVMLQGSAR